MGIRPIGNRVLAIEEKIEEKRASGLIIPGNSEDKKVRYARVVAAGRSVEEIKAEDRIIFSHNGGREIEDRGQRYILLELDEVLAVVEGEKND